MFYGFKGQIPLMTTWLLSRRKLARGHTLNISSSSGLEKTKRKLPVGTIF